MGCTGLGVVGGDDCVSNNTCLPYAQSTALFCTHRSPNPHTIHTSSSLAHSWCRACDALKSQSRMHNDNQQLTAAFKECGQCRKEMAARHFLKDDSTVDGLSKYVFVFVCSYGPMTSAS